MKKFLSQLPSEINLLNPNLISFMHIRGIFHLPTYVLEISTTELRWNVTVKLSPTWNSNTHAAPWDEGAEWGEMRTEVRNWQPPIISLCSWWRTVSHVWWSCRAPPRARVGSAAAVQSWAGKQRVTKIRLISTAGLFIYFPFYFESFISNDRIWKAKPCFRKLQNILR